MPGTQPCDLQDIGHSVKSHQVREAGARPAVRVGGPGRENGRYDYIPRAQRGNMERVRYRRVKYGRGPCEGPQSNFQSRRWKTQRVGADSAVTKVSELEDVAMGGLQTAAGGERPASPCTAPRTAVEELQVAHCPCTWGPRRTGRTEDSRRMV